MQIGVIYKVTNLENLKCGMEPYFYIGSKKSYQEWKDIDYYGSSKQLLEDIHTQHLSNFKREIIELVNFNNYEELLIKERNLLLDLNAVKSTEYYNLSIPDGKWFVNDEIYTNIRNRKQRGSFTESELEGFKKSGDSHRIRKGAGDFTDKELEGYKKIKQYQSRKTRGEFSPNELEAYRLRSIRYQNGDFTDAELKKHNDQKIRKQNGNFTDAEIEGYKKRSRRQQKEGFSKSEKLWLTKFSKLASNTIWINNTIKSKRISENKLDQFLSEGWIKGRLSFKHKKNR